MAEVKWIKITTDMFDNRKIKQIRHLPEGNNIVLIWVMLLTIAGRCNAGGMIMLTENIPYTLETLSVELDFQPAVVKTALEALQNFGMIIYDDALFVANWEKYQSADRLDKLREYQREYHKGYREKQKLLAAEIKCEESKVPRKLYVNGLEEDTDKDLRNKNKKILEEFAAGDSELLDALKEFDSFRKQLKKPLTDKAKSRLINKLQTFPKEDWVQILHKSIDKGWTDVYPLDNKSKQAKQTPKQIDRSFKPTEF